MGWFIKTKVYSAYVLKEAQDPVPHQQEAQQVAPPGSWSSLSIFVALSVPLILGTLYSGREGSSKCGWSVSGAPVNFLPSCLRTFPKG